MAGVNSKGAKRKLEDEHRTFQDSWEQEYCFIPGKKVGSAICLLCRDVVNVPKRYNLNRHHSTVHGDFVNKFPLKSKKREEKVQSLKKGLFAEQKTLFCAASKNELTTKASYQVAHILASKMKPFTDGEIIKECMTIVCDTLFQNFPNNKQICDEIGKLQLSNDTCTRRVENLSESVFQSLLAELRECDCFSLALDSSTDLTSISQLLLFVRYCNKEGLIKENLLGMIPMYGQTRGVDYLEAVKTFFQKNGLKFDKLISVCTDGCPSMVGVNLGFVSLLKKEINKPDLLTYHCILHQENLASKVCDREFPNVMKKVVNFIRARELNHRMFQDFLNELNAQYGDVLFHAEVRWLSRGKVLKRFFNLRNEIKLFTAERNADFPEIDDFDWWLKVALLTDVTEILNKLQTDLQGENKIISEMNSKVFAFVEKLKLYLEECNENNYSSFPTMQAFIEENPQENIDSDLTTNFIANLLAEIEGRFNEFRKLRRPLILVENPWAVTPKDVSELSVFGYQARDLKNELIELQHYTAFEFMFHEKRKNGQLTDFWKNLPEQQFKSLVPCAKKILSLFGSTYLCEATFSKMKFIKNKNRTRISNVHLEQLLRLAVTTTQPDIDTIVRNSVHHRPSTSGK